MSLQLIKSVCRARAGIFHKPPEVIVVRLCICAGYTTPKRVQLGRTSHHLVQKLWRN